MAEGRTEQLRRQTEGKAGGGEEGEGGREDAVVMEGDVPPRLTSGGRAVQPMSLVSVF